MLCSLCPGHASVQVEPPPQFTEQLPVHVMWQVAPPEQSTLALLPTVIVHIEVPVHLRLHESPHDPLQSFEFAQSSVQLCPHELDEIVHVSPDGQAHDAPLQVGGVPLLPPHAMNTATITDKPARKSFISPG